MLAQLDDDPRLRPLRAPAEELATGEVGVWDAILLKESLHHVAKSARRAVLHGLARQLAPGGRLVVVMLPPQLDHPLFTAALDRLTRATFTPTTAAHHLADAGLDVTVRHEAFPVTLPTTRWLDMVRARYMSLLNHFTDDELAHGLTEIRQHHRSDTLAFNDRYAFVVARLGGAPPPRR